MYTPFSSFIGTTLLITAVTAFSEPPAEIKPLLDREISAIMVLSTDSTIVAAVNKYNAAPPSTMTNDTWKKFTLLSPEVKSLIKNDIGKYLKTKQTAAITEMFLNGADGGKVAFLSKTTSWTHKAKSKHEVPMTGKTWIGEIEQDESSGTQQIQVGIPIMDQKKVIGSLVVGFGITQMKEKK